MPNIFSLHPLFEGLKPAQQTLLEPLFELVTYKPNTVIFEQGDQATHLFLLVDGTIEIRYKPYDGPTITVTHLHSGDVFGWSAVVESPQYTSSIISNTKVDVLRVQGSDLRKLVKEHSDIGELILNRLSQTVSSRWKNARAQAQSLINIETSGNKNDQAILENALQAEGTQIRSLLERLSAYVEQFHGGTVEFVSFDGKNLKVKLGGACLDCPLQPATLHGWVAGTVHQFFPDVEVMEEK